MNRTLSFRRMRFASALLFAGVLQPFTSTLSADEPATSVEVGQCELSTGDTVVFLGDSITHQRLYTQYIEDFFITRYPSIQLHFHNSGIGGDQAWDALQRLQRDVLDQSPELVTILLGMNDGRYQPFNREIFDTYQSDMSKLLDRLEEANVTVSPITPTMFDEGAARAELERRRVTKR
ncbi:GDSL-type esterase/lipase family protein [Rhodopirellula sp. MGV]|uniref:GDSL-type esterase/lipase family protein n=1 Tax=Rhodopirellula sp. MGV TaxID=2023130 RepID=UPI0013045B85|nr:GDSL-type esterase/lipase family protein [Rhodopirellula sp. MGV]